MSSKTNTEGHILNAIHEIEKLGWVVNSLNIPEADQKRIMDRMFYYADKKPDADLKLQSLFGYPVYSGKLGITILLEGDL